MIGLFDIIYFPRGHEKKKKEITSTELVPEEHQILIMLCSCIWAKIRPQYISIYTAFTEFTGEGCWSKDT